MESSQALGRLKEGNKRYVAGTLERKHQDTKRRSELAGGQQPFAAVLSCADSRVVPELIFDTGLGELFICRVAGNIANTDSIASLEYAIANLGTKLIVVLGHQSCGAVNAAIAGGDNGPNLNHLVEQIQPSIQEGADPETTIRKNAQIAAQNLGERSSILKEALSSGGLQVVPGYYSLESGEVEFLD